IRGIGFVKTTEDIESATVRVGPGNTPIQVKDVATVSRGPAERRGALTLGGAEAVGGVVVVREGFNPLEALNNIHAKITELSPDIPAKAGIQCAKTDLVSVRVCAESRDLPMPGIDGTPEPESWGTWLRTQPQAAWPDWLTLSTVSIEPFYDRT